MRVRMPDGVVIENVPDGMSQEDLIDRYTSSKFQGPSVAGAKAAAADVGPWQAGMIGAGRTGSGWVSGAKDLMALATRDAGARSDLATDRQGEDRAYKALQDKYPWQTLAGEIAPYLGVPGGPAVQASMAALEYGTPEEKALRGGVTLGAGRLAGGMARMFGPKTMSVVAGESGNKWGIPLTMAQATGSKPVQISESVLANVPFASGVINKARDASYSGFNRAMAKTFGEDVANLSPEFLGATRNKVGGEIGLLARRNTLIIDPQLAQSIASTSQRAQKELVGTDRELVNQWISNIIAEINPATGTIAGTTYKALDSKIGSAIKGGKGTVVNVLGDLRDSIRSGMDRSISPVDSAAWKKANHDYFNLNQVADAAKQTPGSVSPAQLMMSVNRSQRAAKFGAGNDLSELAQWAKNTLPDQIPNSGTAQRLFYQKLLTNPVGATAGLLGLGYGANQVGVDVPAGGLASAVLLPYLAARGMAGKPASDLARKLLERGGGLLGVALD